MIENGAHKEKTNDMTRIYVIFTLMQAKIIQKS